MSKISEIWIGKRFGRLTVVGVAPKIRKARRYYSCACDCGGFAIVEDNELIRTSVSSYGKVRGTKSCGCLLREQAAEAVKISHRNRVTHGMAGTRIYCIWKDIKRRCKSPSRSAYKNYGGRGISICKEWDDCFDAFYQWSLANGYADHLSIDRIDVNGNYEPSNCRWVDGITQARNKRNTLRLSAWGETKSIFDWCEDPRCATTADNIRNRLTNKWSHEDAIIVPSGMRRSDFKSLYLTDRQA